jgi:putative membrane protein
MHATLKIALAGAALLFADTAFAQGATDFLTNAAKGDNAEIKLGKLAEQKGGSAGVRRFGATLVRDHTMAKRQVATVAKSMSLTLPAPSDIPPDAQQEYDKLSQMSGADFDRELVNHMVDDHQKDIADFTKEADAHDGKASQLAAKQLPVLKKHLRIAQSLQKKDSTAGSMSTKPQP